MICSYIRHPPSPGRIACVGYHLKIKATRSRLACLKREKLVARAFEYEIRIKVAQLATEIKFFDDILISFEISAF